VAASSEGPYCAGPGEQLVTFGRDNGARRDAMNATMLIIVVLLTVVPLVLVPARAMGHGRGSVVVGAVVIVVLMMAVFIGLDVMTSPPPEGADPLMPQVDTQALDDFVFPEVK
jgi:hypothetical protein